MPDTAHVLPSVAPYPDVEPTGGDEPGTPGDLDQRHRIFEGGSSPTSRESRMCCSMQVPPAPPINQVWPKPSQTGTLAQGKLPSGCRVPTEGGIRLSGIAHERNRRDPGRAIRSQGT